MNMYEITAQTTVTTTFTNTYKIEAATQHEAELQAVVFASNESSGLIENTDIQTNVINVITFEEEKAPAYRGLTAARQQATTSSSGYIRYTQPRDQRIIPGYRRYR